MNGLRKHMNGSSTASMCCNSGAYDCLQKALMILSSATDPAARNIVQIVRHWRDSSEAIVTKSLPWRVMTFVG